jgi:tRNA(Ile)-lysidine synthase
MMKSANMAQATDDATNLLLQSILAEQERYRFFSSPAHDQPLTVIVGVSGGADSVCLLHALVQLAAHWRLALHVAHLDHNLRPESAADAHFVAQLAAELRLPIHCRRLVDGELDGQPGGLEAAARRVRYTFLAQIAINVTSAAQVPVVALAHQADDQAETLLLNLVRGSGLQGLGGMQPIRELSIPPGTDPPDVNQRNVCIVRPLLRVRRSTILAYLQQNHLAWREDASNADTAFVRNHLRHQVLPLLAQINPGVVETLTRTAQIVAADAARLQELDRQRLATLTLEPRPLPLDNAQQPLERIVINAEQWLALPLADQRGVLRQALAYVQPGLNNIGFDRTETLIERLHAHRHASGPHPLLADVAWSVAGASKEHPLRLSLHRNDALPLAPDQPYLDLVWRTEMETKPLLPAGPLHLANGWTLHVAVMAVEHLPTQWRCSNQPWQAYLDADQVGEPVLTAPQPGLRFAPLGMHGQHKGLGDFFTNRKVPLALRSGWPIVVDARSGDLLWVCGLSIAERARITVATKWVLHMQWFRRNMSHLTN